MENDVYINPDVDQNRAVIRPVEKFDRATIRKVPIGSHILLVNLEPDGVTFTGNVLDEEVKDGWINGLRSEDDEYASSTLFYVEPDRIKDPYFTPDGATTPEGIVEARIKDRFGDDEGLFEAIEAETITPQVIREMLIQTVKDAREGFVRNPF